MLDVARCKCNSSDMKQVSSSKIGLIQTELQQGILRKQWKVGEKLPTEVELARHFGCSVGTVNKAVSLLAHNGMVERKPRMGTRVLSNSMSGSGVKLDAFAFICPSDQHEGVWRAMKGFQQAAQENGRRMLMLTAGTDYQKEVEIIGRLAEFDVLGAALYPVVPTFSDLTRFSKILKSSLFPVVLAGVGLPGQELPCVVIDGFHAGYTMTHRMIEKGVKKIGFLASRSWSVSVRDRYQGYKWALSEAGIVEDESLVILDSSMNVDFVNPLDESTALAQRYLDQVNGLGVEAVVCYCDFLAQGFISAAAARGLRVPQDLLVSGIDDYAIASSGSVQLTTYRVPYEQIGRVAFEMLEQSLSNQLGASTERHVRGDLVIRESA